MYAGRRGAAGVASLASIFAPVSCNKNDGDGDAVVNEAAVVVVAGRATYALAAVTVPATLTLSDRWQERWTLLIGTETLVFWRDAALVLRRLHPVVTDQDLIDLHAELASWWGPGDQTGQPYIDAAWAEIQGRLLGQGRRPELVMSPWSLRTAHLALSLSRAFRDFHASAGAAGAGKYKELADGYSVEYEAAWSRLVFSYDSGEDDEVAEADQDTAASPVLMLVTPGRWTWGPFAPGANPGRGQWGAY